MSAEYGRFRRPFCSWRSFSLRSRSKALKEDRCGFIVCVLCHKASFERVPQDGCIQGIDFNDTLFRRFGESVNSRKAGPNNLDNFLLFFEWREVNVEGPYFRKIDGRVCGSTAKISDVVTFRHKSVL